MKLPERVSPGNMASAAEQAKLDRERVNKPKDRNERFSIGTFDFSDVTGCGLSNPCKFGKHEKEKI